MPRAASFPTDSKSRSNHQRKLRRVLLIGGEHDDLAFFAGTFARSSHAGFFLQN